MVVLVILQYFTDQIDNADHLYKNKNKLIARIECLPKFEMCLKLPPNDPAILGNFENKNDLKQVSKYALQQRKIKPN